MPARLAYIPVRAGLVTAMHGLYFPNEKNALHHCMQTPKKGSLKVGEKYYLQSLLTQCRGIVLAHEALKAQSREQRASKQKSLVRLCEQETGQQSSASVPVLI